MEELWRKAMATLNVKNLPDGLYRKLQARARRQRRSVAQEVTQILSDTLETPKPLSILDLRGLGKEHWHDVEAATHVTRERPAWD
jgi:plasmid stability protein